MKWEKSPWANLCLCIFHIHIDVWQCVCVCLLTIRECRYTQNSTGARSLPVQFSSIIGKRTIVAFLSPEFSSVFIVCVRVKCLCTCVFIWARVNVWECVNEWYFFFYFADLYWHCWPFFFVDSLNESNWGARIQIPAEESHRAQQNSVPHIFFINIVLTFTPIVQNRTIFDGWILCVSVCDIAAFEVWKLHQLSRQPKIHFIFSIEWRNR